MSNKENIVKELKSLLETAQRELLKEINANKNFFQKIFGKSETLQLVQSNLAKALNQITNLNLSDTSTISKIQTHLNERNQELAEANTSLKALQEDNDKLLNKVNFLENQLQKLEAKKEEPKVEEKQIIEKQTLSSQVEEELVKLQEAKRDLEERFAASQESLADSQSISTELNKRLKRLKTELIAQ